ncbi:InlB B-repeat-containing protein [Candidatus Saccharibacteria bacterium]|nr:InlB B-repeat-containing protein [Candidatus Saccharibacteria bacterium]
MAHIIHTIKTWSNMTKYNISQTRSRLSPSLRVRRSSTSGRCPADGLRNITFGLCKTKYYVLYMVGFVLLMFISGIFTPFYISDNISEATTGNATESTISLSLSSNNISLNLLQPGTYDANNLESGIFGSASTTASVSTTNSTGYTLSIAATNNNGSVNANNDSKLIDSTNTDTSRNYFDSITSAVSESDFSANTVAAGNNYNGKWGYKPSYYNSVANSNYLPAPSTSGVTIEQTTAPNTTAKDYTITLGARANINQSAGSYSNTFNIVATANPVTYSITYSDNSGDSSVANLPSVQASSLNAQSKLNTSMISLSSTTPTRTGYTFSKWCLGTVSNSGTTCTGTEYNAGADFGIDQTINNSSITLYAKWTINTYTCTKRYRLQNADGTYPSTYTSDGSEQINYGSTCSYSKSVTYYQTQSTSKTNMNEATTLSLDLPRNTYTLTVSAGSNTSSPTGSGTYRWGQSVTVGVTKTTNSTCITYATPTWSVTSGSGSSSNFSSTSGTSTTYTMPTGNSTITATSSSSRNTYIISYNKNNGSGTTMSTTTASCGTNTTLSTNTFTRPGYAFLGWSTSNNAGTATYADAGSINLERTAALTLYAVWSNYMQDINTKAFNAMASETTYTLKDKRDNQEYTVAKLKDGKLWMTKNLNIAGGTLLTPELTDFTDDYLNGFSTGNNLTKTSTGIRLPNSANSFSNNNNYSYVYNTNNTNCSSAACYSYYSYDAATLGSGRSLTSDNVDASYSICPKGWRLPTSRTTVAAASDFYTLAHQYGLDSTTSVKEYDDGFYTQAGPGTLPNFVYNSSCGGSCNSNGSDGSYYSSTSSSANRAHYLHLETAYIDTGGVYYRYYGRGVRCLFAG